MTFKDNRRYTRARVELHVSWGWTPQCLLKSKMTSLSAGGCFIQTELLAIRGQAVYVALWIPTEKILRGEVRYNLEGIGVGVEFLEVSPEERERIAEVVEYFGKTGPTPSRA
jgi:hypothetical protein